MAAPLPQTSDSSHQPVALIVEDELLVRILIVDILMDAGFEVIEAETGSEALMALAGRSDVDLIVSDVRMPGTVDGFMLARRAAESLPQIGVIILSGWTSPQAGDLPKGARFIPKPFQPDALLALANQMVGRVREG